MCKIIVMANQKGGVAKTSSTRNLAYSLAELGKKVLAVDFDPQTNLTISFGVAPAALQETAASLMMKLVMDEALPEKESCILNIGKVDLLPSKKTLTVAEVNLLIERKDDCLAKLLAPLRADYDYILVDTGPSLGSLTINAFTAADEIIIPVDPELFALVGLKELTETISKIKQNLNPKVEIIGILFTKCSKRTTLYRQTSEQVRSVFGHLPIFESQIPATVQVGTANSKGLSVMELDAKSPAAAAYMEFGKGGACVCLTSIPVSVLWTTFWGLRGRWRTRRQRRTSLPSLEITKFKCFRQRSSVVSGDTPSGCMRATDLMTW